MLHDRSYRGSPALRQQHWVVLGLSMAVIALSVALTTDDRRVAVAGLGQWPFPDICQSRVWLNLDCPGCGMTRSFIHFFHGRFADSLRLHRIGWLLALLTVLQIPYRLVALRSATGLPLGKAFPQALVLGAVVLLSANWLLKLAGV
jgi:hypothetical protein